MESHNDAVIAIAQKVATFYAQKQPFRMYHGSTNSTRQSAISRNRMVDTSRLNHVLSIDRDAKFALVEPNVPMDALVDATLRYGLIPPVVMEFPGITVGGGFSGTAGESSSFRWGFFDRTIDSIDIILANGELHRNVSRTHMPDLFFGAASSFGTLGVITLLRVQLIEAKTYVDVTYHRIGSIEEAVAKIEEATEDESNDYLDGIMFAKNLGVICTGRLSNEPQTKVQRFTRATDPWFYIYAQRLIQKFTFPVTESVPIVDYVFRYDRGGFWVGRYAYRYFLTPFNRITRYLLDYFMHTRVMYHALHKSGQSNVYIIQDVAVPYKAASEFINYLEGDFKHYPLWLCPLKQTGKEENGPHGLLAEKPAPHAPEMLLNFGVWGPGPSKRLDFINMNRRLEQKVDSLGGQKWLYAQAYYTEDEFWRIHNREDYDLLRQKYHATHLPTVYDKVKVDFVGERQAIQDSWKLWVFAIFWSIWPLSGLYGVLAAMLGGDYLLPKSYSVSQLSKKND